MTVLQRKPLRKPIPRGPAGVRGPIPAHEIDGPLLRFQKPDGAFGDWINTLGPEGPAGEAQNFATRTVAGASVISAGIAFIRTAGLSAAGDGGGRLYVRADDEDDAGPDGFSSNSGAVWWKPAYNPADSYGRWEIAGLRAENNPFPVLVHHQMQLACESAVLHNPNTKRTRSYAPGDVPTGVCDINVYGPGGRDQEAAFAAGDSIIFYLYGGPDGATDWRVSKTAPLASNGDSIGPVLSEGYDVFAPAFTMVVSEIGDLVFDSHQTDELSYTAFQGGTGGPDVLLVTPGTVTPGTIEAGDRIHDVAVTPVLPEQPPTFILSQLTIATAESGVPGKGGSYQLSRTIPTLSARPMTATTPYPASVVVRGNEVWFSNAILHNVSDDVWPVNTNYLWPYDTWIPKAARTLNLELDIEISAKPVSEGGPGLSTAALVAAWNTDEGAPNSGNDVNLSCYNIVPVINGTDVGLPPSPQNTVQDFLVVSGRKLSLTVAQIGGETKSLVLVLFTRGYKCPYNTP